MLEKMSISGIGALLFSLLGKVDWLILFYGICMFLDYVSGTLSAIKSKSWSASRAAQGIWKKIGSIFAVICGAILDLLLFIVDAKFPNIELPINCKAIFCCVVLIWYIVTELGSIAENAGRMGAPIPKFLKTHLDSLKNSIDSPNKNAIVSKKKK